MGLINCGIFARSLQPYCIGLDQKMVMGELQIRANLFQVPQRHLKNASGTIFLIVSIGIYELPSLEQ
ncbi:MULTISPECIES: hypothetical protein [unclassified Microcoleus]|uniref:hypothetical protein n=1 Tax=unclassified Microcoleus TaxID=2642155 RepID=UPI002FD5EE6D